MTSMRYVSAAEMAEIDRRATQEYGIPASTLMENAGKAVADEIEREFPEPVPVCVVFGKGKNGGDGLVVARLLSRKGYAVTLVPAFERETFEPAAVIVDAIFGTGLNSDVTGRPRKLIERINEIAHAGVYAVDVPSGLDADTGRPRGIAVRAHTTVTMGLPKKGFLEPGAERYLGRVVVADIGFPRVLLMGGA